MRTFRLPAAAGAVATALLLLLPPGSGRAEDWFMPPLPLPDAGEPSQVAEQNTPPPRLKLPPIPQLPALPRGPTPPAAVIGVLGVPEVMRASTAARQVEKVLGARREKLNQDARKEQAAWRDLQQSLTKDRSRLSAEQIRSRERQLQERITGAQRKFRERNKIIQDAAQYALAQIERTLIGVIRQVSESRGMNLVLHRAQVALNVNEFDITKQVTDQLNKVLPSVDIPPDGQEPPLVENTPEKPGEKAGAKTAQSTATKETAETAPAPASASERGGHKRSRSGR